MLLAIECISVLPLANLQHAEIEQLVSYARQTYDSGLALTLTHTLTLTLTHPHPKQVPLAWPFAPPGLQHAP